MISQNTFELTDQQYFDFSRELEEYHAIFYKFWEMGKPTFSEKIPTAAVSFNKEGSFIEFIFNPIFWQSLTALQRKFIICHESLHIILDHGSRAVSINMSGNKEDQYIANIAMDIVVNHMLVSKFGFNRKTLNMEQYVWVESVFKGDPNLKNIPTDECFEYYYTLLHQKLNETGQQSSSGDQSGNEDSGQSNENNSGDNEGNNPGLDSGLVGKPSDIKNEANKISSNVDRFDDHGSLPDSSDSNLQNKVSQAMNDLTEVEAESLFEDIKADLDEELKSRGCVPGGQILVMDKKPFPKKKKWETVIRKWAKKFDDDFDTLESWTEANRRIGDLMKHVYLPTELDREIPSKSRIDLYFFLDTSGSCVHLADRFWKAAKSLPENKFKIHLFCFDTKVYRTSLKSGKLYGFGGTSFDILEQQVQKDITDKLIKKHPEAVFVITDGYGNNIRPKNPQKWHWFLTGNYTHYIPKTCKTYDLKKFE